MARLRLARRRGDERTAETGYTLLELSAAMGIFSIFVVIFIGAVVGLSRGTTTARLTAEGSSGALIIFQNMDRQVRYADSINFSGAGPSGARYIEFRTPAANSPTGVALCTQWRYVPIDRRVESRTWQNIGGVTLPGWSNKVNGISDIGGVTYPFQLIPTSPSGASKQQVRLRLQAGDPLVGGETTINTVFVARNSSSQSPSNLDANNDGNSDTPVCQPIGSRP
jgi:prepilin-type N-terminal cleavage/methylation domain-containing protein